MALNSTFKKLTLQEFLQNVKLLEKQILAGM